MLYQIVSNANVSSIGVLSVFWFYTHSRHVRPSMIIHWMSSDALKCFEFLQHILFEHVVGNYKFWCSYSHSLHIFVFFENMYRWFLRAKSGAPWGWMVPQPTMLNGSFLVVPLQYGSQGQSCLDDFFCQWCMDSKRYTCKRCIYVCRYIYTCMIVLVLEVTQATLICEVRCVK